MSHGPQKARQFPGHGHHHLVRVFASSDHASLPFAPSSLRLPPEVLDRLRELFQPAWPVATDVGGIPVGPGPFDEGASGVGGPGLGARTLPAALTTGICCRDQAQLFHHVSGILEARQVAERRHEGHSHGAWHATQGFKGLDHRRQSPRCDLFRPFVHQALETCGGLMDRAPVVLEDDVWRRGGADPCGEPPQMGRAPGRPTRRADIVAEPNGVETALGGLELSAGVFTCPAEVADGLVRHRRDLDGGKVA